MSENKHKGWVGVDLDGTLATYNGWGDGSIGEPVLPMVERVKAMLAEGVEVRIVTARACSKRDLDAGTLALDVTEVAKIEDWCEKNLGARLKVQFWKDFSMIQLWDDRAVQVIANEGLPVVDHALNALSAAERIFLAANWTTDSIPSEQQARLWENLRVALGIPENVAPKEKKLIVGARQMPKKLVGRR